MRKVAIVHLSTSEAPSPGGVVTTVINFMNSLNATGRVHAESMIFYDKDCSGDRLVRPALKAGLQVLPRAAFAQTLNSYDFAVYFAPGTRSDWWREPFREVRTPFAVLICSEDNATFPYRWDFFDNLLCRLVLPIAAELVEPVLGPYQEQNKIMIYGLWDYQELHHPLLLDRLISSYTGKDRRIVYTSRISKNKGIVPFVNTAPLLSAAGWLVEIWGVEYRFSPLRELQTEGWVRKKPFSSMDRDTLSSILLPALFHYNGTFRGIGTPRNGKPGKRIELTSYEAAMHGCALIVNRSFAPDWVTDDEAVLVDIEDDQLTWRGVSLTKRLEEINTREMNMRFIKKLRRQFPLFIIDEIVKVIHEELP